jgi:predicted transcriptional regulator
MKSKLMSEQLIYHKIKALLEEIPGQSVRELAQKLEANRSMMSGYLQALEDLGYVTSRQVGPARVYYNNQKGEANVKVRS